MNNNYTDNLIEIADKIVLEDNLEQYIEDVKCSLLDYFAVTLKGAELNSGFSETYILNAEKGCTFPIGITSKLSLIDAAFLNGCNAHFLELDDGQREGMIHPGAPIISALLPIAAFHEINGLKISAGVAAGYEIAIRLARAIQPEHKKRGFHASSTCGTIGAAMAIAYALDFNSKQKKSVLAAAVTCAGGILALQDDSSQMKPINVGAAAAKGIIAAKAGSTSIEPPIDPIAGERGFLQMYSSGNNGESLLLQNAFPAISTTYRKRHSSCRHSHGPIDSILRIREIDGIDINEIARIDIYIYDLAINGHDQKDIENSSVAKLSIPYAVAIALLEGNVGIEAFDHQFLSSNEVQSVVNKVNIHAKDEFSVLLPKQRASETIVTMKDGRKYSDKVDNPRGEPETPYSINEINEKYSSLLKESNYDINCIELLREMIFDLDKDTNELSIFLRNGNLK